MHNLSPETAIQTKFCSPRFTVGSYSGQTHAKPICWTFTTYWKPSFSQLGEGRLSIMWMSDSQPELNFQSRNMIEPGMVSEESCKGGWKPIDALFTDWKEREKGKSEQLGSRANILQYDDKEQSWKFTCENFMTPYWTSPFMESYSC